MSYNISNINGTISEDLNTQIVSLIESAVQNISIIGKDDSDHSSSTMPNNSALHSNTESELPPTTTPRTSVKDEEEVQVEKKTTNFLPFIHENDEQIQKKKPFINPDTSQSSSSSSSSSPSFLPQQETFPIRLHHMLDSVYADGLSSIVSWLPHGRAFAVHNHDEFVAKVLSKYFRQSKFSSFQRQMNLYGFSKILSGPDKGAYYHELFLRGKISICQHIIRSNKKNKDVVCVKEDSMKHVVPNFYAMPPLRGSFRRDAVDTVSSLNVKSSIDSRACKTEDTNEENTECQQQPSPLPHQNEPLHKMMKSLMEIPLVIPNISTTDERLGPEKTYIIDTYINSASSQTPAQSSVENVKPIDTRVVNSSINSASSQTTAHSNTDGNVSEPTDIYEMTNGTTNGDEMVQIGSESYHYLDIFINHLSLPDAVTEDFHISM